MARKPRVRQHVNPLNFREEVPAPRWGELLEAPDLPREVDVGCAHGDFLLARAESRPDLNLIGLEIRAPMVERVQRKIDRAGLRNAAVLYCNANMSFREWFPEGSVRTVYVHFPDPWFKKRHHKRRVITPGFIEDVAVCLRPGGRLRFLTDYADYASEVFEQLDGHPVLVPAEDEADLPLTHREDWHRAKGDAVHRGVWARKLT